MGGSKVGGSKVVVVVVVVVVDLDLDDFLSFLSFCPPPILLLTMWVAKAPTAAPMSPDPSPLDPSGSCGAPPCGAGAPGYCPCWRCWS